MLKPKVLQGYFITTVIPTCAVTKKTNTTLSTTLTIFLHGIKTICSLKKRAVVFRVRFESFGSGFILPSSLAVWCSRRCLCRSGQSSEEEDLKYSPAVLLAPWRQTGRNAGKISQTAGRRRGLHFMERPDQRRATNPTEGPADTRLDSPRKRFYFIQLN